MHTRVRDRPKTIYLPNMYVRAHPIPYRIRDAYRIKDVYRIRDGYRPGVAVYRVEGQMGV